MPKNLTAHVGLDLWRRALVGSVAGDGPDLTARQMALMLTVYLTPPPHTVRGLATTLNVSKPAVTRAIDRLSELDYLRRKPDEADRRSILLQRTIRGSVFLRDFGEQIVRAARAVEE
ncbi:MAG: MarR family transcriptional regulator [Alphaproteobacteria bacterium]|nr:MarR family transcriptional regulator [Alphaproteobacteria bacterium]